MNLLKNSESNTKWLAKNNRAITENQTHLTGKKSAF